MLDLTRLVKKPRQHFYVGRQRWEWRTIIAIVASLLLVAPIVGPLIRFGWITLAVPLLALAVGAGLAALVWRPDGMPLGAWIKAKIASPRAVVTLDDGTRATLHAGLAPLVNPQLGQTLELVFPAVEVAPNLLDDRGAFMDAGTG